MSFVGNTRRKLNTLTTQTKGTANPLTWEIPKAGLLAGIYLNITGSVAGTLTAPNALGFASIVRRVRLMINSGQDLINISGPGYHYLLRQSIEDYRDPVPASNARSAVTAAAFDVSMYLPVTFNARDPLGLVMLQNEQTQLILTVEFESDAVVATGATVTATVTPAVETFTVPVKTEDWPPLTVLHQVLEEQRTISGAGLFSYRFPRGNTYTQMHFGLGMGVSGADNFTSVKVQIDQSNVIWGDLTPGLLGLEYTRFHGLTRLPGTALFDLSGTSGLGVYASSRDWLYSGNITELEAVINAAGAGTLYAIRRLLVALQ